MLHTGGDDGSLGGQQRHSLTLHVGAHQGTVGVVILQEGNEGGSHGDHHSGGNIDVIDDVAVNGDDLVAVTAGDTLVGQAAVLIQRLVGLGFVPYAMALECYDACPTKKFFFTGKGAGHGLSYILDRPGYMQVYSEFIKEIL